MESISIFRKLSRIAGSWLSSPIRVAPGKRHDAEDMFWKGETLAGVSGSATQTPPGDETASFYREMTMMVSGLFQPDVIAILVPDANRHALLPLFTIPPEAADQLPVSVIENDETTHQIHTGKSGLCFGSPGTDRNIRRGSSFCQFPIMHDERIEAILFMTARNLSSADREMISGFCKQAALVIGNQNRYRTLSERMHEALSVADALSAVSRVQSEKELLCAILNKSADLLKAARGSLILVNQEDNALLLKAKLGDVPGLAGETRMKPGEGISGMVAELGQPMLVENIENDPRIRRKNRHNYRTRSFVSVPIRLEDRTIGVINLADKNDGAVFTDEDLRIVQSVAAQAAIAIDRALLQNKIEELKRLSATDQLTGLVNRRYIFDRLKDELARSKRSGQNLSILMLDLDGFKRCNDLFGHLFGDQILTQTAKTLLTSVRSMDIVARYGGDEFLVILPETSEEVAAQIAERIRAAVDDLAFCRESAGTGQGLSTSIGLVSYPAQGDTIAALLSNADAALYRAKENGKNRVEIMKEPFRS